MFLVKDIFSSTYEIKKSKFISYISPYNQFQILLKNLKVENPKARHFVFAFRHFNEFNQIVERSSDDGEPKGTSGKPTLNVLSGNKLIDCAIITVRYFGGIKLGTGGLVKSYSNSANLVIQNSNLINYIRKERKRASIQYQDISKAEYYFSKFKIAIISKNFDEVGGNFILEAENSNFQEIIKELKYIITFNN